VCVVGVYGRILHIQGRVSEPALCPCGVYYKRRERRTRPYIYYIRRHVTSRALLFTVVLYIYIHVIIWTRGRTILHSDFRINFIRVIQYTYTNHRVCGGSPHMRWPLATQTPLPPLTPSQSNYST